MATKLWSSLAIALFAAVLASGCATNTTRAGTVPDSAWDAAPNSTRTSAPPPRTIVRTARPQVPNPGAPLSKQQVLDLAAGRDPQQAIAEIDRHPLAFPLDASNIAWFEDRLVPPEVADYLKKRAQVDWAQVGPQDQAPMTLPPPPPQPNDGFADVTPPDGNGVAPPPAEAPAPSVVVEDQPTVVYDSSPTVIVGTGWYDGAYWRPWRPWYRSGGYVSSGVVYSNGYGGLYYTNGAYVGTPGPVSYGRYPYTGGSFVYGQSRGYVSPPSITRPAAPQTRPGARGGSSRGGGHGGGHR